MFGYIRPVQSELLVREYELYRAVYCGLCRYGGKHISHFTRFFLNYDFVSLALLRIAVTNETVTISKERCPYRFRKRSTMLAEDSYRLTCAAFAILLYYKTVDDINDSRGFKRIFKKMVLPFFSHIKNRVKGYDDLDKFIQARLLQLGTIEKEIGGVTSLDKVAHCFAGITEYIACYGMSEEKAQIAAQCGYHIGRYIYILDALDDIIEDNEKSTYNPLINKYGSVAEALAHTEEIKTTITDSMNAFSSVYGLNLIGDNPDRIKDYDNIIFNICDLGGKAALNRVLFSLAGYKGDIRR
ncbi:MAG: hypothetical protein CVU97_03155 [Firmicutes bacterium HGW-Firmicutes-21]|nr:MAG: hypothetical protein CVU97_03155 [Firmicutes bacterium HGW-Firmicutes-21]